MRWSDLQVILFDWWVRNEDRTLTEAGGNSNLLWGNKMGGLRVFDLNLAFDDTFDEARFWQMHVFSGVVSSWPPGFREEITKQMELALKGLPRIWRGLPDEWLYEDGGRGGVTVLSFDAVGRMLNRFREMPDKFWTIRK